MEEEQIPQPQPSISIPPKKFPWKKLSLALIVFILVVGGAGAVLAWRTTYLDNYLPASVKEFFGKGEEEAVPPVISSVKATDTTETGVTITWTTNVEATSQVEYGTTASYGSQTTEDTTLVTSHSVALSGLTKGTLYHFRVISKSTEGGLAISDDYTFTTEDPTKDWKTWENETFGISFRYPKTYQIDRDEDVEAGKVDGTLMSRILELSDQTRSGNPKLKLIFNFCGDVGICPNDISYNATIENGRIKILSREFSDRAKTHPCNLFTRTNWDILFSVGATSVCDITERAGFFLSFSFERTGPDYEPELREIIKSIRITKEDIYGK